MIEVELVVGNDVEKARQGGQCADFGFKSHDDGQLQNAIAFPRTDHQDHSALSSHGPRLLSFSVHFPFILPGTEALHYDYSLEELGRNAQMN